MPIGASTPSNLRLFKRQIDPCLLGCNQFCVGIKTIASHLPFASSLYLLPHNFPICFKSSDPNKFAARATGSAPFAVDFALHPRYFPDLIPCVRFVFPHASDCSCGYEDICFLVSFEVSFEVSFQAPLVQF